MAVSVPAAGAGTSVSTFSVDTSTSGSSRSASSPTCFSQSRTGPSGTDSPIWGMVIWTVVRAGIEAPDTVATPLEPECTFRPACEPCAVTDGGRRRKFWGWGFEDEQPSQEEVAAAGRAARAHLAFETAEVAAPP